MKSKRITIIISLTFLMVCSSVSVSANDSLPPQLSFSHVLQDDIETLGYINTIAQDIKGFMWFGGVNGLARYDGYELKIYRKSNSHLGSSFINKIIVTKDGVLWVATRYGLSRYDAELDRFETFFHPGQNHSGTRGSDIASVIEDSSGRMWLGTRDGLYLFEREQKAFNKCHLRRFDDKSTEEILIWSIAEDRQGGIWIGTHKHGVIKFEPVSNDLFSYPKSSNGNGVVPELNDVRKIYVDESNMVWAVTYSSGLFQYNAKKDEFIKFTHDPTHSKNSKVVWDVLKDSQKNLFVGDGYAVNYTDSRTGKHHRFVYSESRSKGPGNYRASTFFEDRAKNVWIGYFPSGVDIIDREAAVFRNYKHNPMDNNSLAEGGVLDFQEEPNGDLWIATGYGLSYFYRDKNIFSNILYDPKITSGLSGNTVLSLLKDTKGALWAGIYNGGVSKKLPGDRGFVHYMPVAGDDRSLMGKEPWDILEDSRGDIWLATELGFNRYNRDTNDFTRFKTPLHLSDGTESLYTRVLYEDKQNNFWVGTVAGLFLLDRDTGKLTKYAHDEKDPASISANFVKSIYEDSRGTLWIGTHGGGVNKFDRKSRKFSRLHSMDIMPDDIVTSITEDQEGYVWFATHKGLVRYSPKEEKLKLFGKRDGLPSNLFTHDATRVLGSGEMFVGSNKGFTIFDPGKLTDNEAPPPVVLTGFEIFNQPAEVGVPGSPLEKSITELSHLSLEHYHSVITFEFSALNYLSPELNQYAYRLEGFEKRWNYVESKRTATYTNLDPGHYILHIKASNNDGVWNEVGMTLPIRVKPPLWKTWWAYGLYVLLLCVAIYLILYFEIKRQSFQKEKQLNQRLTELDKLKDEFLANTSHELRTPLNGMIGLAESLRFDTQGKLAHDEVQKLDVIVSSGRRLSSLVNDILDYSKLTDGSLELNKESVDFYTLTEVVFSLLEPLVRSKPVKLVNALSQTMPRVYADENRLQQVLINLVGNAIKFSSKGYITVSASVSQNRVVVSVEDNGVGINAEKLQSIFEPFKQADQSSDEPGTGLGLTVTRKLIQLHGGEIRVRSQPGQGTEFIFDLEQSSERERFTGKGSKISRASGKQNEVVTAHVRKARQQLELAGSATNIIEPPENSEEFKILIVDDDAVNRMVLQGILALHRYKVVEAESGEEALRQLSGRDDIDLVILDVMMPGISGFETCKKIRKDYPIDILPVIFLSAKTSDTDLISGYNAGGNEFIIKPVSKIDLLPKVATYLKTQKKQRATQA